MVGQHDRNTIAGLHALHNFLRMLNEAAAGCRMPMEWRFSQQGLGIFLDGQYWLGLSFEEPDQLCFQVDAPVASGIPPWRCTAQLGSAGVRFYSLTAVEQMRWLETFLHECLEEACHLPVPDQTVLR
jgi:hypothetical protein